MRQRAPRQRRSACTTLAGIVNLGRELKHWSHEEGPVSLLRSSFFSRNHQLCRLGLPSFLPELNRPVQARAALFTKVRAKVWIEQATYHWVKMDAEALDTLTFGLGLLRVAPGGTLQFEQVKV